MGFYLSELEVLFEDVALLLTSSQICKGRASPVGLLFRQHALLPFSFKFYSMDTREYDSLFLFPLLLSYDYN